MTPLAFDLPSTDAIGQWVLRLLAVAGAAALGGLLSGLTAQGLSRLLTTRPIPRIPLNIIRILGAVVCGWVVWIILFHGLGGGRGGSGSGWWPFGGPGTGNETEQTGTTGRDRETGKGTAPRDSGKEPADGQTLQVEVLPAIPSYRVAGEPRPLTYDEFETYLRAQKKASPNLKGLKIVLAEDVRPDVSAVTDLTTLAKDNGLTWTVSK